MRVFVRLAARNRRDLTKLAVRETDCFHLLQVCEIVAGRSWLHVLGVGVIQDERLFDGKKSTATPRSLTAKARILITTVGNLHEFWDPFAFEETKCSFSAAIVRNAWTRRTRTLEKFLNVCKAKLAARVLQVWGRGYSLRTIAFPAPCAWHAWGRTSR